jgi:hypothetical protein
MLFEFVEKDLLLLHICGMEIHQEIFTFSLLIEKGEDAKISCVEQTKLKFSKLCNVHTHFWILTFYQHY